MRTTVALLLLLCAARPASADWFLSGYTGAAHTRANTLTVTAPAVSFSLSDVTYVGQAFKAPIYYGYRIGWSPRSSGFGVEGEFTHAKAIATTRSAQLPVFRQTHGLNFVLANVTYRRPVVAERLTLVARGGGGFTLPHVEGTFAGVHTESYQYGGLAWQGGVGVEVHVTRALAVIADGRLTATKEELDVSTATVNGSFVAPHVNVGVAWHFGN